MMTTDAAIAGMTFSPALVKAAPNQTGMCSQKALSHETLGPLITPAVPRFIESEWFLGKYAPAALERVRRDFSASAYAELVTKLKGSLYWAKGRNGDKDLTCPRMDPAAVFQKLFPLTFAAQNGSLVYTSYPMLERYGTKP